MVWLVVAVVLGALMAKATATAVWVGRLERRVRTTHDLAAGDPKRIEVRRRGVPITPRAAKPDQADASRRPSWPPARSRSPRVRGFRARPRPPTGRLFERPAIAAQVGRLGSRPVQSTPAPALGDGERCEPHQRG
jgi:hypothetical protein